MISRKIVMPQASLETSADAQVECRLETKQASVHFQFSGVGRGFPIGFPLWFSLQTFVASNNEPTISIQNNLKH